MKRLILCLVVTALLVLALAVPAFALKGGVPAVGNSENAKGCHDFAKEFGFPPGECTRGVH